MYMTVKQAAEKWKKCWETKYIKNHDQWKRFFKGVKNGT